MNNVQLARYNAYEQVVEYLAENTAITKNVPAVEQTCKTIREHLQTLLRLHNHTVFIPGEAGGKTRQLRDEISRLVNIFAAAINKYAGTEKAEAVKEVSCISFTELRSYGDPKMSEYSQEILDRARSMITALQPYGITERMINDCDSYLKHYIENRDKPRNMMAERMVDRMQVRDLLREISRIYETNLDPLMRLFKKKNRRFYRQYLVKRAVAGPDSRPTRILGRVYDGTSYEYIPGVKVTIMGAELSMLTGTYGEYLLLAPLQLTVLVLFEKEGYKTKMAAIPLKKGKVTVRDVELVRKKK